MDEPCSAIHPVAATRTDVSFDYREMTRKTEAMLKKSFDSFVDMNPDLAREVMASDDEVDEIEGKIVAQTQEAIRKYPDQVDRLLHHMFVARHLERIADHATNIAEDIIYMVEGQIIRHGGTLADRR